MLNLHKNDMQIHDNRRVSRDDSRLQSTHEPSFDRVLVPYHFGYKNNSHADTFSCEHARELGASFAMVNSKSCYRLYTANMRVISSG